MKPLSIRKRWLSAASASVAVAAVAAASAGVFAAPAVAVSAHAAAATPLVMESSQESTLADDFNPFDSTSAIQTIGATSLIYESLLQFDIAKPLLAPYKFLATSYQWGAGGKSITFTIRSGVNFSNGSPMTPADVAFTYNMLGAHADTNSNGIPLATTGTVATVSGQTVTINFSTSAYTDLQYIGTVPIVPAALWSGYSDPGKATISNPIGTGPYVVDTFSSTAGLTLKANSGYWGGPWASSAGAPKVPEVDFPLLDSNSTVLNNLEGNTLDWAGNFLSGLSGFVNNSTHFTWFDGVNTNSLEPNTRSFPMNILAVRKAVSLAIDRNQISATGESGLEPPATNASGIVLPNFSADLAPAVKKDSLSGKANPKAADAVLKAAGAKLKGGWYYIKGKKIVITITDPSDYTDYAEDDTIMAQNLVKAHIDASFDGLGDAAWYAALANGTFGSATSHWSNSSIVMYGVYEGWLDDTLDNGTSNSGDFEGIHSSKMQKDLKALAGATTLKATLKAITPIEEYVATQYPVIPTVYGASFDEYSTVHFTGWPTKSNAYESGSPNAPTNEVIVLHLTPVS